MPKKKPAAESPEISARIHEETLAELRAAIAIKSDERARLVLRTCRARLREGTFEQRSELVHVLLPLARHTSAIVRQGVADLCEAFPEGEYDETHQLLLIDRDAYVRAAAEAAGHRRAQRHRGRARIDGRHPELVENLAQFEKEYGKRARRMVERAVQRGVEMFVQKLHEDMRKIYEPMISVHREMLCAVALPSPDIARLTAQIKEQIVRVDELYAIVDRACERATRTKPSFVDESVATGIES